jgi:ribosomal protein S18 acetylase RimI-like enzyme
MSYEIKPADAASLSDLHQAMLGAFSDYVVPMRPPLTAFEAMLKRRSFVPALSRIAVAGGEVAAIWLMGKRRGAAYLICSGTLPAHRGNGLAQILAQDTEKALRSAGVTSCQTEVIETNRVAAGVYFKLGYKEQRRLQCYDWPALPEARDTGQVTLDRSWPDIAPQAADFRDWLPSWQNADAAVDADPENLQCASIWQDDRLQAYAISDGATLMQIAVRPEERRKGMGRALVAALAARTKGNIRLLNADAADKGFAAFMAATGAEKDVMQLELRKQI